MSPYSIGFNGHAVICKCLACVKASRKRKLTGRIFVRGFLRRLPKR